MNTSQSTDESGQSAILVIAHGSRRAEANADLVQVAEALAAEQPQCLVQIAYLELATPSIPEGLIRCRAQGARHIRMLPYFLSAGSHVTRDLEAFRQEFLEQNPDTDCVLCPPLGLHPLLISVLLDRLQESVGS